MRRKLQKLQDEHGNTNYSQDELVDAFNTETSNNKKKAAPKRSYRARKRKQGQDDDCCSLDNLTPLYTQAAGASSVGSGMPPPVSPMSFGMPELKCGFSSGLDDVALGGMNWMQSPMCGLLGGVIDNRVGQQNGGDVKRFDDKMFSPTALFGSPMQRLNNQGKNNNAMMINGMMGAIRTSPTFDDGSKKMKHEGSSNGSGSTQEMLARSGSGSGSSLLDVNSLLEVNGDDTLPLMDTSKSLDHLMSPREEVQKFAPPHQILDAASPRGLLMSTGQTPVGQKGLGIGFSYTPSPNTLGAISRAGMMGGNSAFANPSGFTAQQNNTPGAFAHGATITGPSPSPQTLQSFFDNVVTSSPNNLLLKMD